MTPWTRSGASRSIMPVASAARRQIPAIAIGGAVGKTTTKELTAAAARALFGRTLATTGNLNNLIGVPLTLLGA